MNTGDDTISNPKKEFEFDRVYGPHVGQGEHTIPCYIFSTPERKNEGHSIFFHSATDNMSSYLFVIAAELFSDVQPLVQSALDGSNVSVFAYGQTRSGKTHTMVSLSLPLFLSPACLLVHFCVCAQTYVCMYSVHALVYGILG